MSFLQNYIDHFSLDPLSPGNQKNLQNLENELNEITKSQNLSFEDVLKEYQPQIMDLIDRLHTKLATWKFSWSGIFDSFQFVKSISLEVVQMVNGIESKIIDPVATQEENKQKKISFSVQTACFIWAIVNPIGKYCNWIPFKKTIEKKLVNWIASMSVKAAFNFFDNKSNKPKLLKYGKNAKTKKRKTALITKSFL